MSERTAEDGRRAVLGGSVMWESWKDVVVLSRYAGEPNARLCRELGVSERTLERHARALGVAKSSDYMAEVQRKGVEGALRRCDELRRRGEKRSLSRAGGRPFERGHRLSAEVEAKRVSGIKRGQRFAKLLKSCNFGATELSELTRQELGDLFEARKRALIAVRDEIDRRDRGQRSGVNVEWTNYVENGDTD